MNLGQFLKGNTRFSGKVNPELLRGLWEKGQKPFATVIACSDSRAPVEVIFDQLEPGNLFVIRVAGNVVGDVSVRGSIEYAVNHLGTPYPIVLGHTDCGAVKACLEGVNEGELSRLLSLISPESQEINQAVIENVALQLRRILALDTVKEALEKGALTVYGMLYDLKTGRVSLLSENGKPVPPLASSP